MLHADYLSKHQRFIAILDEFDADTIVLRKSPNITWISGGRVHVHYWLP